MTSLDWIILFSTLAFIVIYGTWKSRGSKNIEGYLKGDNEMKWYTVGLSIMATQASAITFLSTPGQAFEDGMRFIQFYFGLPIAMVIISFTIIPIYYKLKVYTAYEYLENRFDYKTRLLAAFLFLVQRGLAAGITIYAPAIILSSILGWNLNYTNIFIGVLVIIYTVAGGTKAVSQTQKQQMLVILAGMTVAFVIVVNSLPAQVSFSNAVSIAGTMGKMNVVDFSFDFTTRYTFWSGITGGLFLAMSYFGTDQSQVQRYLSGKSLKESRLGLMFNGLVKIPMQFLILFTGIMVFVFYQFEQSPVFFNETLKEKVYTTPLQDEMRDVEKAHTRNFEYKKEQINQYVTALDKGDKAEAEKAAKKVRIAGKLDNKLRKESQTIIKKAFPESEAKDTDYIFISFIMKYLPTGVIGLLLAVIFSAAMSSTAGELNALASTTVVDFYKRRMYTTGSDTHYLQASKWFTVFWGAMAILFATFASLVDNLIQAVNILGSIFYGTILGIFLSAFYIKIIKSKEVFIAAVISQITVILLYFYSEIGFLWYNVIGCGLVIGLALIFTFVFKKQFN
ncbi:MAG: sodium:solute symporter [Bacteroidota bacterium]|nr:sodium:solute symporter [Bacteroidota bacterium]